MIHMFRRFSLTFVCFLLLAAMSVLLVVDNLGVSYSVAAQRITSLPDSVIAEKERYEETSKTCLVLRDSTQENSDVYTEHVQEVLEQMRVGYHLVDVSQAEVPAFSSYRTVVLVLQRLDVLGDTAVALCEWVKSGGGAMLFCTPESTPVYRYLSSYLGVEEGALSYAMISGMELSGDFMIGSEGFQFHWGEPMTTALDIRLKDTAKVYAYSDDENRVPLVWENDYGEGRFVVMNHGMSEKTVRGLTCAAYSLLEDTCVYPVINASSFFLDDFPSPVPMGDGQYIRRDYNRDISSFYSNVWWPDMLQFCDDYGVRYTGMIIEDYSDEVDGLFPRQSDQERFNHFGALLLDYGGEIGLHGYNHQPLCFTGFDFQDKVDYNTWKTKQDAVNALTEVLNFTQTLFPDNQVSVYVPPSNILSEEGRELLHTEFPQIKTISSLYIEGEIEYIQEFEIAEDGIVEFPRVISGALLDQYDYWAALNALNLYYVNSHFIHPDDVLDEDRGAALGWETLHENLGNYMDWLYTSAPNLRNLTASEASCATERYDVLSVECTPTQEGIHLRLTGFWDEAYLMVRCNNGTPAEVEGGALEHVDGDYYLLRATEDQVDIRMGGGK